MPKKRHQGLEASIPNIIALERYKNVQSLTWGLISLACVLQMNFLKSFIEEQSDWSYCRIFTFSAVTEQAKKCG